MSDELLGISIKKTANYLREMDNIENIHLLVYIIIPHPSARRSTM